MFVTRVLRTHSRTTAQKLNMESLRARWRAHLLGNSVNYHLQSEESGGTVPSFDYVLCVYFQLMSLHCHRVDEACPLQHALSVFAHF